MIRWAASMLALLIMDAVLIALLANAPESPVAPEVARPAVWPTNAATEPPNSTPFSDGIPPVRYQKENGSIVLFLDDISTVCGKSGDPKMILIACQFEKDKAPILVLPNPCKFAGIDWYARIACHELGHRNGWPRLHGD